MNRFPRLMPKLRDDMRLELTRLQQTVGITFMMVTHDQDEALAMASRIAVMDKGAIKQLATPSELYEHPANKFVADFIGKVNVFEASVLEPEGPGADVRCQRAWARLKFRRTNLAMAR